MKIDFLRSLSLVAGLLIGGLMLPIPATAQALWSLSLNQPDWSVQAGTADTLTFTGVIANTDTSQTLDLEGDAFTTGVFDSSLSLEDAPDFDAFLNNTGSLGPGQEYSGALFTLTTAANTPEAESPPYDGTFVVMTDGAPPSLSAPFTLTVQGTSSGSGGNGGGGSNTPPGVPEPGSAALALGFSASGAGLLLRRRAH